MTDDNLPEFPGTELRGAFFIGPDAEVRAATLKVGDYVVLTREPTNRADRNALRVEGPADGEPVAYVAREVAAVVSPLIDRGATYAATVDGEAGSGRYPTAHVFPVRRAPRAEVIREREEAPA